jgi:hypothetical protein
MRTSTRTLAFVGSLLTLTGLVTGCTSDTPAPTYEAVSCDDSALDDLTLSAEGDTVSAAGVIDNGEGSTQPYQVGVLGRTILAVTGEGATTFTLTDPSGVASALRWGPIERVRTTLEAEGREYALGLHFSAKGCWTLTASNETGTVSLVMPVQASNVSDVTG